MPKEILDLILGRLKTERNSLYNQQTNNLYAQQAQKFEWHCILHFLYGEAPEIERNIKNTMVHMK